MSGVPVLYSGDEIAQLNDYGYHDDPFKAEDSRYLHRGDLDWKKAARRNQKTSVEGRVFRAIKRQEELRAQYHVFDDAADTWVLETHNDHVLGIGRYYRGEKLLALFNFSDETQIAWVQDLSRFTDLITGERRDAGAVELPAGGWIWLHQTL